MAAQASTLAEALAFDRPGDDARPSTPPELRNLRDRNAPLTPGRQKTVVAAPEEALTLVHGQKHAVNSRELQTGRGAMEALGGGRGQRGGFSPSNWEDTWATETESSLRGKTGRRLQPGALPSNVPADQAFGRPAPPPRDDFFEQWNPLLQGQRQFGEESSAAKRAREDEAHLSSTQRLSTIGRKVASPGVRPGHALTGAPAGVSAGTQALRDYEWPEHINPATHSFSGKTSAGASGSAADCLRDAATDPGTRSNGSGRIVERPPEVDRFNVTFGATGHPDAADARNFMRWPDSVSADAVAQQRAKERLATGAPDRAANPLLNRSLNPRPSSVAASHSPRLPALNTAASSLDGRPADRSATSPKQAASIGAAQLLSEQTGTRGWYGGDEGPPLGSTRSRQMLLSSGGAKDALSFRTDTRAEWEMEVSKAELFALFESAGVARTMKPEILEAAWEQVNKNQRANPKVFSDAVLRLRRNGN
jgi:hypothetical protein